MNKKTRLLTWLEVIAHYQNDPFCRSRTCHIYNHRSKQPADRPEQTCPCGRLIGRHSLTDACLQSKTLEKGEAWTPPTTFYNNHSCQVPINVCGVLKPYDCHFLRLDHQINSDNSYGLYQLILDDCGGKKPDLILSISGGRRYFLLKEQLKTEIVKDIIDIAVKTNAWILTDGTDTGISKHIGEGISHYRIVHNYSKRIICIGLTMWGLLSEEARQNLKKATDGYPEQLLRQQIPSRNQKNENRIEDRHSHCILFDDGRLIGHSSDANRDAFISAICNDPTCYAITIMFGGDLTELEVLENSIKDQRSIILIRGSGRLTDMLVSLLELTSDATWNKHWNPTAEETRTFFDSYFSNYTDRELIDVLDRIDEILDNRYRHLFRIFCFERGDSLRKTIFNAILSAKKIGKPEANNASNDSPEVRRSRHENKLLDLAFKWDYIDGVIPILQRWQDEIHNTQSNMIETYRVRENDLFKKCLEHNRLTFVDVFLTAGFDPRNLTKTRSHSEWEQIIKELYNQCEVNVTEMFNLTEHIYCEFTEPFLRRMDIRFHCKTKTYGKDEILRDLFLWSVFMNMPDMAKILLVHLQSRICASLIASAVFKNYAQFADVACLEEKLRAQAVDFESYAVTCINKCYELNERTACELLFRKVPLFGDVTCAQIAIFSKCEQMLQTACFDQALKLVWYSQLKTPRFLTLSAIFAGLPAPILMEYRKPERHSKHISCNLSSKGINYYNNEPISKFCLCCKYSTRLRYFHASPVVKMFYHFISYLVFLFMFTHMGEKCTASKIHWMEIYVTLTVTTMLCESVIEMQRTQMFQTWFTGFAAVLPYILYYVGVGLRFASENDDIILQSARFILILDLELWYLHLLKFAFTPKLFMLENRLRHVFAFVFLIFITVGASRPLVFDRAVYSTVHNIAKCIFYIPSWSISTKISHDRVLIEARTSQVLLYFHLLFIIVWLAYSFIQAFDDKDKQTTELKWHYYRYITVQEYFSRPVLAYPPFSLISYTIRFTCDMISKCCLIFTQNQSRSTCWIPVFKMIPNVNSAIDRHWDIFESTVTYTYARLISEQSKKSNTSNSIGEHSTSMEPDDGIILKRTVSGIQQDVNKVIASQHLLMETLLRSNSN
ncbi:unnamed protein product [Adineta ricciae]|uniref:Uncharacterized protein n=1 Tax=Adineta ricciae TaxID=249248 RepID=A0A814VCF3_ADIRI|nr:unnamed protein product [Adineta ricciae]